MSNPFAGLITAQFKEAFNNAIDALLEDSALTVPCQLIFTNTSFTDCPNCLYDSMSGRSSNIYNSTGPIPFANGNCPYCHGIGTTATDNTKPIHLMVIWNYRDWIGWNGIPDNSMTPFGQVQTLSKLSTLSDIKSAQEIILDTDIQRYVKHRFQRAGEPNPVGLGADSYIATIWKRI